MGGKMDMQKRQAEIESLVKPDGTLKEEDVVEFARNPDTACHDWFEWDDTIAAEKHRLEQAKCLIRACIKVLPANNTPVRAYVSLRQDRAEGNGYRRVEDVLKSPDMRAVLLEELQRDLQALGRKYECLKDAAAIIEDGINRVAVLAKTHEKRGKKQKPEARHEVAGA